MELEIKGKPPIARFYHDQHYYEKGNLLVILAGKRFTNPSPGEQIIKFESEFVN